MNLTVDPARIAAHHDTTSIYVRALNPVDNTYGSYDIAELDKASLKEWLLSRNDAQWMLDVIGVILGHGYLH